MPKFFLAAFLILTFCSLYAEEQNSKQKQGGIGYAQKIENLGLHIAC